MKILIVDDEPLVQAGIKSMINWSEHDYTIIGTASNGEIAYQMIQTQNPDIVITDIKMPVMSGLDLIQRCYEDNQSLPVFILLTSYEELAYYKHAIKYQVLEYLVKLELTPEILLSTLERAKAKVNSLKRVSEDVVSSDSTDVMRERFLVRLLLNMLDETEQINDLFDYYKIDCSANYYLASYLEIYNTKENLPTDKQMTLYTSSLQMIKELIVKYLPCEIVSLDARHFCVIFHFHEVGDTIASKISDALQHVSEMLFSYYSVKIVGGIGSHVTDPSNLSVSYQDAKRIANVAINNQAILFYQDELEHDSDKNTFNMSLFKDDLQMAFTEYDSDVLSNVFNSLIELFKDSPSHYLQAVDAAGSILYMSLSFLNNGESIVSNIFASSASGYRSLYESNSTTDVLKWMEFLRDGLCEYFNEHNKDFKNHVVNNVKKYIRENTAKKLTLNDVSKLFNISPNYLSVLFSKYNDVGFSDYINQCKVEAAKKMLMDEDMKIYEIADELGFESAFYFSRVFKKITGMSPRDYLNLNIGE